MLRVDWSGRVPCLGLASVNARTSYLYCLLAGLFYRTCLTVSYRRWHGKLEGCVSHNLNKTSGINIFRHLKLRIVLLKHFHI